MSHLYDSAERIVRERIAAGDRTRRGRLAVRQVWRTAPVVAGAVLGLALAARWTRLPPTIPLVALPAATIALLIFVYVRRREVPVSDAAATRIDDDAGMRGELRSANWFVESATRDTWAEFHLLKAAERLQAVDWAQLYPAIPARRSQVLTAALIVATIGLMLTIPEHVGGRPTAAAAAEDESKPGKPPATGRLLDPELQRQLEELLAAAAAGDLPSAETIATDAELRDMFDKLAQLTDAELLDALKRALASNPKADLDTRAQAAAENLKRLAEQAKRGGEVGALPKELQEALDKLSDQIELAKGKETAKDDEASATSAGASDDQMEAGENGSAAEELSIQFAKASEAGGAAGMMMMSNADASQPAGPPGSGAGGSGSDDMAAAGAAIEAALKKETVEASQDSSGRNVETEIRRKTEHGNATVTFTGGRSGQFDKTRATAPPPVPEARRTGVQTYFVRQPQ